MIDIELIQKAIKLTQDGKFQDAKEIYENLLKENPNDSNLLSVFGLFYVNIGDYDKACEILRKANDINETFGTISALGFAEFERGNYKDCATVLERALRLGENPDIYNKLVLSLFEIHNYQKAVEYADKMYELYPDDVRAIANKVKSLTHSGKLIEAEKLCVEALKKDKEAASLWFHLGFLKELIYCNDKQAKECYQIAANLGNPQADYNIAVSSQKLGDFEEAEKHYKVMLKRFPNDVNTITSLGMCYLTQKKFKEGYDLFFKRNKSKFKDLSNNFWKPEDKLEDEINIICDQGYGDHIMFVRYLPFLKNRKINVGSRDALRELFAKNYSEINFVSYEELNPNVQTVFITDLAYVLGMDFDNIPYSEGYLNAGTANIENAKTKVGFCWEAGSAGIRTMINRTINIKFFEKMLNLDNIQVYSFQVDDTLNGNERYSQMINLAKDFKNFSDTASALKAMDLVVTVDTSVAHLAGALGVKTFLLLPYATDWRWFRDTKKTPWYDSIEIFKQQDHISWEREIDEIVEKICKEN